MDDREDYDVEALVDGKRAAREGRPIEDCPHPPGNHEYKAWVFGWCREREWIARERKVA